MSFQDPYYLAPITSSALLAGSVAGFSISALPALVRHLRTIPSNSPDREVAELHTLSIFRQIYDAGKRSAPPIALGSTLLCLVNAYRLYGTTETFNHSAQLAIAAGVLNMTIVPVTFLMIAPTNKLLFAREEAWKDGNDEARTEVVKKQGGQTTESLLNRWIWLNFFRASFPLAGAVLAWYAC